MDMLAAKHVVDAVDDIRGAVWSSTVCFTSVFSVSKHTGVLGQSPPSTQS